MCAGWGHTQPFINCTNEQLCCCHINATDTHLRPGWGPCCMSPYEGTMVHTHARHCAWSTHLLWILQWSSYFLQAFYRLYDSYEYYETFWCPLKSSPTLTVSTNLLSHNKLKPLRRSLLTLHALEFSRFFYHIPSNHSKAISAGGQLPAAIKQT